MTDAHTELLARLGITPLALPVPFPDAGGPVNVYAIEEEGGGYCLFDTGIGGPEGERALEHAAATAGLTLRHVRRVIVSHGHVDHYGNAQHIAELSGARVRVHPKDWDKVVGDDRWAVQRPVYLEFFERLGVPKEGILHLEMLRQVNQAFSRRVDASHAETLQSGARLRFRHFEAEVVHLPGHTPGLVCLWDEAHRMFFADDHVLARISPNPLLDLDERGYQDKFQALAAYLHSAKHVHAMDIDWVLPGHGAPFQGHRRVLESLFAFYAKRQKKIVEHLKASPTTAYELISVVFGRVDPLRLFLMLSEVVGNLEVLEAEGRLGRREKEGRWVFEAA
ncbi:MAG: MBL fold metallo-hydrolase [Myxococcaceae bacterium]